MIPGSSELLWLAFALVGLGTTVVVFRFFGKEGLYVLAVASVIVANIQVTKTVVLFGLTATLGNVLYGSVFLATDVLSEVYGSLRWASSWCGCCSGSNSIPLPVTSLTIPSRQCLG